MYKNTNVPACGSSISVLYRRQWVDRPHTEWISAYFISAVEWQRAERSEGARIEIIFSVDAIIILYFPAWMARG